MTILKYFGSHFCDLGTSLWDDIEQAGGRLKFVTQSGFVVCHRVLMVYTFPSLFNLFCTECDSKGDDSVIIAPEADIDQLIAAVEMFYKSGDTEQLNNAFLELFGVVQTSQKKNVQKQPEIEQDYFISNEENYCKTIDAVESENVDENIDNAIQNTLSPNSYHLKPIEEIHLKQDGTKEPQVENNTLVPKKPIKRKRSKFRNVRFLSKDFLSKSLPDGKFVYLCNKCGKGCSNMSGAARHSFFCSGGDKAVKNHICENCGKIFKTRKLLSAHVEKHSEKGKQLNNFSCDVCGKQFKRKELLERHSEKHTTGLDIRIKIHTETRSKSCHYCGKIFKKKKWLNNHIKNHMDRKYIKEEPNSDSHMQTDGMEKTRDQEKQPMGDFMSRHLDNGRVVYQCRKCFKSCRNTSGASRHAAFCKKESNHGGASDPLPCELCSKICQSTKGLKWHMKQVHE